MDYLIRKNKEELDSTGYMEIGPGKYSGKHWQDGFLFVWEDAFGMAEGIVLRHFLTYDHFSMNDIPKAKGELIIRDWRAVAEKLGAAKPDEVQSLLNLDEVYRRVMVDEVIRHRSEITTMLNQLSDYLTNFYEKESYICILGM